MHQHRQQDQHHPDPSRRRTGQAGSAARRASRRTAGGRRLLGAVLVPLLGLGVLTAGPAPVSLADSGTPGAPPMPAALSPGKVTAPVFPLRSVPGYSGSTNVAVRLKPGDGGLDKRYKVPTPAGSTLLWGDWNRDGAYTPIVFTGGSWAVYDGMLGPAPVASRTFAFGLPGDRPVVGDWNGDGTTDVGVVRGGTWYLRNRPTAGEPWRRFAFGRATDVPVTGDWDGNRRDGIGIRRGARYLLRDAASAGKPTYDYKFGKGSDAGVVGDWNGDGVDSLGVVRGSRWYLRSKSTTTAKPRPTVVKQVVSRLSDPAARPVAWPTLAGRNAAACPTATARVAKRPQVGATIVPSRLLDQALPYDPADPALTSNPVFQLRMSLLESEKYLLGAQYIDRWYGLRAQRFANILTSGPVEEWAVRRPAMAALTTAVAVRTKVHNDSYVGRTREEAIRYTDWLVRSIACEHAAVSPGGWGAGWQTAHWAFLTGEAAYLVWDQLTPQTREYVGQMLVFEADQQLLHSPAYWADSAGNIVLPGNTQAEEDAWNAGVLELAVMLMPKHAQAANWRRRAVDLEVAAFARRSELASPQVVNGVTVADRIDGANAYDDGTVENHRQIHPDYMTTAQTLWWAADVAGLTGRVVPEAVFHNGPRTYGVFSTLPFTAGAPSPTNGALFDPPGGTMYRPGSNDIYFPQGSTWGTVRRAHFVSFDAHALAYGLDTEAAWPARDALAAHLTGQQALVAANGTGDGRTYSFELPVANTQDTYPGREEYAASQLAQGWLALYVSANAWDKQFNVPPLNKATYAPLPPLTPAQTGWFGVTAGSSPDGERRSP